MSWGAAGCPALFEGSRPPISGWGAADPQPPPSLHARGGLGSGTSELRKSELRRGVCGTAAPHGVQTLCTCESFHVRITAMANLVIFRVESGRFLAVFLPNLASRPL